MCKNGIKIYFTIYIYIAVVLFNIYKIYFSDTCQRGGEGLP